LPQGIRRTGNSLRQPVLIFQSLSEGHRCLTAPSLLFVLSKRGVGSGASTEEIEMLLSRLAGLGQMRQRIQGLVEVRSRLRIGRAVEPSHASLARVEQYLVSHLTPERMMGQPLDLLGQAVGMEPLKDLDDPGVEGTAPLLE
jgi:hypothetical protein